MGACRSAEFLNFPKADASASRRNMKVTASQDAEKDVAGRAPGKGSAGAEALVFILSRLRHD